MRWTARDILLELPGPPGMDEASAQQVRELITKGATDFTVGFSTDNCQKTYETLLAKSVEFTQEPVTRDYGTDMGLRDPFANHIRIVQPAPTPQT